MFIITCRFWFYKADVSVKMKRNDNVVEERRVIKASVPETLFETFAS